MITSNVENADIILLVAASDIGAHRRRGQNQGAKQLHQMVCELETPVKILDYGRLFLDSFNLASTHAEIERAVREAATYNKPLLMIGGDHSISYGALKVFSKAQIHSFDAHPDLVDEEIITAQSVMSSFKDRLSLHGVRYTTLQEKNAMRALRESNTDHVYISIDVDVLDPKNLPGVAYPTEKGWSFEKLKEEIRHVLHGKRLVCADIVEYCPLVEEKKSAQVMKELLIFIIEILNTPHKRK
ncbi:hypothetical protein COT72_03000 [archaeon CG10_big_fil_rev_8_21_14_0_10_43_11]|nr:MAG: hypothetical protein COT72_03000 [archaeon CG10_big_fil_rev_8_21_14_0_10_43_11]